MCRLARQRCTSVMQSLLGTPFLSAVRPARSERGKLRASLSVAGAHLPHSQKHRAWGPLFPRGTLVPKKFCSAVLGCEHKERADESGAQCASTPQQLNLSLTHAFEVWSSSPARLTMTMGAWAGMTARRLPFSARGGSPALQRSATTSEEALHGGAAGGWRNPRCGQTKEFIQTSRPITVPTAVRVWLTSPARTASRLRSRRPSRAFPGLPSGRRGVSPHFGRPSPHTVTGCSVLKISCSAPARRKRLSQLRSPLRAGVAPSSLCRVLIPASPLLCAPSAPVAAVRSTLLRRLPAHSRPTPPSPAVTAWTSPVLSAERTRQARFLLSTRYTGTSSSTDRTLLRPRRTSIRPP